MTNYLAQKAMLASLNISQWSARRLDRKITDEVNKDHGAVADAGRYNKLLVAKDAIRPIQSAVTEARITHMRLTQPWGDTGSRILPAALYEEYTDKLAVCREAFERAVRNFVAHYPEHVKKRQVELNGLFEPADYPDPEKVADLFDFGISILPCPDADDFRVNLAKEHAEDIRLGIEKHMKEALSVAMQEPVRRVIDSVGRMAERLANYQPAVRTKDGVLVAEAQSTFRDSLVDNIRDLVTILPAFNLTNDLELTRITNRMADELCGEPAQILREDEAIREQVAQSAASILDQAKALMA